MDFRLPLLVFVAAAGGCGSGTARAQPAPGGAQLFFTHCAACHGEQGEGDGPVASVMSITVPNLRTLAARNGGTFPVEAVAAYVDGRDLPRAHGNRIMPVWGEVFAGDDGDERRLEAVIGFVRELQYEP